MGSEISFWVLEQIRTNIRKHCRRSKSSQNRMGRYYKWGTDNLRFLVYCPTPIWITSSSMRYNVTKAVERIRTLYSTK